MRLSLPEIQNDELEGLARRVHFLIRTDGGLFVAARHNKTDPRKDYLSSNAPSTELIEELPPGLEIPTLHRYNLVDRTWNPTLAEVLACIKPAMGPLHTAYFELKHSLKSLRISDQPELLVQEGIVAVSVVLYPKL